MAPQVLRIGTRDSQLAVWQATLVQNLLAEHNFDSELVYMKSEGDIDTVTPLYELGVQGVFTKTLDAALLNHRVDLAVHSMKDVPTLMAKGLTGAAVLKRASHKDILVYKQDPAFLEDFNSEAVIATSSIRRIAQWRHRYPNHSMENLRGNVNTRLRKVADHGWHGAIFAAAGLERIGLRPQNSINLDWMLPAPAQGAIMIVCREDDHRTREACTLLSDATSALCTRIERDFLRTLAGGCSTPISALAELKNGQIHFRGNVVTPDGKHRADIERMAAVNDAATLGVIAANELLSRGGDLIMARIRKKAEL